MIGDVDVAKPMPMKRRMFFRSLTSVRRMRDVISQSIFCRRTLPVDVACRRAEIALILPRVNFFRSAVFIRKMSKLASAPNAARSKASSTMRCVTVGQCFSKTSALASELSATNLSLHSSSCLEGEWRNRILCSGWALGSLVLGQMLRCALIISTVTKIMKVFVFAVFFVVVVIVNFDVIEIKYVLNSFNTQVDLCCIPI